METSSGNTSVNKTEVERLSTLFPFPYLPPKTLKGVGERLKLAEGDEKWLKQPVDVTKTGDCGAKNRGSVAVVRPKRAIPITRPVWSIPVIMAKKSNAIVCERGGDLK